MGLKILTASRKAAFERCQRLEYYQYQLGYRPVAKAKALDYGTLVHVGLEAWWKTYQHNQNSRTQQRPLQRALDAVRAEPTDLDEFTLAEVEALLVAYDVRWRDTMDKIEVLAVEVEFKAPILSDRGKPIGWYSAGKLDVIFAFNGRKYGIEHKTTSSSIAPGSSYLTRLRIDAQVSAYFDGAAALGHELEAFYYDVLVKPGLTPKKGKAPEDVNWTKGKKCGTQKNPCQGDTCEMCGGSRWKEKPRPCANQVLEDETLEEFRERVIATITEREEKKGSFHRERIVRLAGELEAARNDWLATVFRIAMFQRENPRPWDIPPRSPSACHRFGRPCAFWGVCTGTDRLESDNFTQGPIHPELQEVTQ